MLITVAQSNMVEQKAGPIFKAIKLWTFMSRWSQFSYNEKQEGDSSAKSTVFVVL